ncbi:MAG TPA: MFS transporter [Euzebyales bacterium]|nr:MFS transporter [Euzebyales bacterium]
MTDGHTRPRGRSRLRRVLRAAVVDITPLRTSRGFRWLYFGQAGAELSRELLIVAVPYQVFVLTGSSLLVGMVGLVQIAPLTVCSILGGTAADAFDRRRLLLLVEIGMALTSIGFAVNSDEAAALWPIFVLIAINAGIHGVESPTRSAVIPALVPHGQLPAAFALHQTLHKTAQVVGPALAGVLIARYSLTVTYWLSAVASVATTIALLPLGSQRPVGASGRITVTAIREGWRYLRKVPVLQQVMLIDLNAMVFGMPRALFPVVGTVLLGGDAATVGLLHAAPGAGALVGAVTTGWVSAVRRQGRIVVCAVVLWGAAIVGFGLTRNLAVAVVLLALAGAADVISNVFRNTILQATLPDSLRGRVTAFKVAMSGGGPRLGDAESGAVAALTTPTISIVSGGLASIAGAALIGWWGRALWDQSTEVPPPAPPLVDEPTAA